MDMSFTVQSHPSLLAIALLYGSGWVFPVGALVLRRHFVHATGERYVAKITLYALAWLSAPLALLSLVVVVRGAVEAVGILWRVMMGL